MSPELRELVAFEMSELDRLLGEASPLIQKVQVTTPDLIETIALGGIVQSFYNGIENVLRRVCAAVYDDMPAGRSWHAELLDLLTRGKGDKGVISPELRQHLREYQAFRHFFRHAYAYRIDWEKLAPLVRDMHATLGRVRTELRPLITGDE